jgi:excisionase family DNA binding protein
MEQLMSEQDEYLDYDQASRMLNVKKPTLYAWVSCKRIPHIRIGPRCIRFSRTELGEWLNARRIHGWSDASKMR